MPLRTTARITALRPGQSPPPVSTPIRVIAAEPSRAASVVGVRRTRDPGARRRGIALGAAALLAFVVGLAAGAGNGDPEREGAVARGPGQGPVPRMPQRPTAEPRRAGRRADAAPPAALARLSLRQRIGELIVFAFAGPALPAYAADILREGRAAGVILFGPNVQSPAQLRGLTAAVQRAAGGDALVAADQEGGTIRIVRYAPPAAGEARQADPAAAGAAARARARSWSAARGREACAGSPPRRGRRCRRTRRRASPRRPSTSRASEALRRT